MRSAISISAGAPFGRREQSQGCVPEPKETRLISAEAKTGQPFVRLPARPLAWFLNAKYDLLKRPPVWTPAGQGRAPELDRPLE